MGKVWLVGAGPGDESLITLKALECLKAAEVVVYDYLANPALLSHCPDSCEKIYAGKMASKHTMSQEDINALLVEKAKDGKAVVRLKGGDPCVFGRGGEEALACAEAGIPFEFVPGITAGIAAAVYAGIPVTHRGLATSVAFITGHEMPGKEESDIQWDKISTGVDTLVFYMGVKNLPLIVQNLKKYGRSGSTPAAVIRLGTLNSQATAEGTLDTIEDEVRRLGITPPSIIVVGQVVSLRPRLTWFENRPLFGKTVLVTRSRTQASDLARGLKDLGAWVREFPTIEIAPVPDLTKLDSALNEAESYSWIVFTSVNGVEIFFDRLYINKKDARSLQGCSIAAIGSATAEKLRQYGITADLVPEKFTSEGTVEAFRKRKTDFTGERVLLPGSAIARDYIRENLSGMGAEVLAVPVYDTLLPAYTEEDIREILTMTPDLVTFSSSSTVSNFVDILRSKGLEDRLPDIKAASIGPVTTKTAEDLGIQVILEAEEHTIPGLIDAIKNYFISGEKT
ncbi:MAG: uroporphyrinogen-III C-methyltransferase [Spirochaetales bacterium]|nr:MAG: uroporphyrinogen-III C-methyltransferase [Spirochaetales bacterium]